MKRAFSVLITLLIFCFLMTACEMRVKVDMDEGAAGQPCRSGGECDEGLACMAGICLEDFLNDVDLRLSSGESCTRDRDCESDLSCLPYDNHYICTARCNADAACLEIWSGSECLKNEKGEFVCIRLEQDGDIPPEEDEDIFIDGDIDAVEQDADVIEEASEYYEAAELNCREGEKECQNGFLRHCNNKGQWITDKHCSADGETCLVDACIDPNNIICHAGESRCRSRYTPEICNKYGTEWERQSDCLTDFICIEGDCLNMDEYNICLDDYNCTDDEYCFRYRENDEVGQCLPFCDQSDTECFEGYQCGENGICEKIEGYCISNSQCETYQFCDVARNRCQSYCYLPGQSCPEGSYCDDNSGSLTYGRCLNTGFVSDCSSDADCYSGQYCHEIVDSEDEAYCRDRCSDDDDCYGEETCVDNKCNSPCPPCMILNYYTNDGSCMWECPGGYACDFDAKGCVPGGDCTPPPGNICGYGIGQCCPPQTCSVLEWAYGLYGICI